MTKVDFPGEEAEFHGAWSLCAGRLEGLQTARGLLMKYALEEFTSRRDDVAYQLRGIADELKKKIDACDEELRQYIAEGDRRRKP
jgi:hypothetical protein